MMFLCKVDLRGGFLVDLDVFVAPLEGENPSGTELRNDPRFQRIERLLEPGSRAARTESPGERPAATSRVDWPEVLAQAQELASAGRDLRLLVVVTRAMANEGGIDPKTGYLGFTGLARGLEMLTLNITTFWDSLHPALRDSPSPREAGLRRINALMQLENDDNGLLGDLQMNAVITPPGLGAVNGHDLALSAVSKEDVLREYSSGLNADEEAGVRADHEARVNRVNAVTRDLAAKRPEIFAAISGGRAAASAALDALALAVNERLGIKAEEALRFSELSKFLDRVDATLEAARAHVAGESGHHAEDDVASGGGRSDAAAESSLSGGLSSREDVERALDAIITFYERTEPASPIPHLARRLRRIVPMDFIELMEELAPGGVNEFRGVAGMPGEKRK